jgi:Fe-S cluster biogenesis protein NfuA
MTTTSNIVVEATAHPRARKFILESDIRKGEGVAFRDPEACEHVPMAAAMLRMEGISEAYFSGNVITVTSARGFEWSDLEVGICEIIERELPNHDPVMPKPETAVRQAPAIGDLAVMDGILEQTIRPYIRSHGGELELLSYDPETARLSVNYLGTCGYCPAATTGTLEIIQNILREEFEPRLVVEVADA